MTRRLALLTLALCAACGPSIPAGESESARDRESATGSERASEPFARLTAELGELALVVARGGSSVGETPIVFEGVGRVEGDRSALGDAPIVEAVFLRADVSWGAPDGSALRVAIVARADASYVAQIEPLMSVGEGIDLAVVPALSERLVGIASALGRGDRSALGLLVDADAVSEPWAQPFVDAWDDRLDEAAPALGPGPPSAREIEVGALVAAGDAKVLVDLRLAVRADALALVWPVRIARAPR